MHYCWYTQSLPGTKFCQFLQFLPLLLPWKPLLQLSIIQNLNVNFQRSAYVSIQHKGEEIPEWSAIWRQKSWNCSWLKALTATLTFSVFAPRNAGKAMPNWCWAINTNSAVISEELCPVDPCTRKKLLHATLETAQVSSKVLVFVATPFLRNTVGEKLTWEVEHSRFPGLWPSELSKAGQIWLSFPYSALGSLCSWCKVRTVCWYMIHHGDQIRNGCW